MDDPEGQFSVDELVEYCQTQARLLHGHVETLDEETAALLSEIDEALSTVRSELSEHESDGVTQSPSPVSPDATGTGDELDDLEAIEADLTEKQAVVKAKQARRDAFEALAAAYLDLAESLRNDTPTSSASLHRILEFEQEHDAPTYFDERVTLLEAAAEST